MAGRIRTIKPELLEDEKASALSDAAWRLFVSSWLLCDDHGRFRAGARYLAAMVWQDTARTDVAAKALDELARAGRVRVYQVGGDSYAEIPSWGRHQRVDHPGKERIPPPAGSNSSASLRPDSREPSGSVGGPREPSGSVGGPRDVPATRAGGGPPTSDLRPPTSDLRPPTNGPPNPSGGSEARAPTPPPRAKGAREEGPPPTLRGAQDKPVEDADRCVWRVWRELYMGAPYRKRYAQAPGDGKAVKAYVGNATAQLAADGKSTGDLEALARHQLAAYLRDTGSRGFVLRDHGHGLRWLSHGLPSYGTPWARVPRAEPEERPQTAVGHSAACKPRRCVCTLAGASA